MSLHLFTLGHFAILYVGEFLKTKFTVVKLPKTKSKKGPPPPTLVSTTVSPPGARVWPSAEIWQ